jgi:hypothetical protein
VLSGLWDFTAQLGMTESEVDPVIDAVIEFVDFSRSNKKMFDAVDRQLDDRQPIDGSVRQLFEPRRLADADILWLKLRNC